MSNVKLIKTGGILDQMVAGTAKKEDLTLPYDRSTQIRGNPVGAKNMSSTFQLPKIQQQNTLSNKLNLQQRFPQPKITPLMAQLGGTPAKEAVPMTPLMQKISAQVPAKQEKIVLEENPNILERVGKTLTGTAKTGAGGYLNTFGYTRRVLDSGIKGDARETLMDFNQREKERLEKELADPKTNTLKRWALEREIRDLDDALTGRDRVHEKKDELMQGGAEDFARAQQGTGWLGKLGLDALSGSAQLGADVLIGKALGTNATLPMAIRGFGSGAHTAEQEGAGLARQGAYGAASAAVEVLTEKMFDGLAGAFGKGAADDIVENLIVELAKTDNGRTALRLVAGAGGEGIEEVVSSAIDPVLRSIYNGQTPLENYKSENIVDWLYEGLVGAIIGGFGGGVNIATGRDAQQNAELRAQTQDVARTPSTTAPALQDIAPQPAQQPTSAQNSLEVKLPAETQSAAQGAVGRLTQEASAKEAAAEAKQSASEAKDNEIGEIKNFASPTVADNRAESDGYNIKAYHGTSANVPTFTKDNNGAIWLSDNRTIGDKYATRGALDGTGITAEVYASIKNPYVLDVGVNDNFEIDESVKAAQSSGADGLVVNFVFDVANNDYLTYFYENDPENSAKSLLDKQFDLGWTAKDGETIKEFYERTLNNPVYSYYAVFSPEQVKLASGYSNGESKPSIFPENSLGAKITQQSQQLPQGMGAASNSFVPEQKVSKVFTNTYQKTDSLTDEQRAQMKPENYQYDVRGHAQNETAAQQRVDVDYEGEVLDLYEKENWSAEDVFTAKKIMDKLSAENDYEKLSLWSKKVQIQGTKPGQTVEAFKAFQKTPEGAVIKAQQVIAEAEKKLTTKKEVGKDVENSTGRKIRAEKEQTVKAITDEANEVAKSINTSDVAVEWWVRDTSIKLSEKIAKNAENKGSNKKAETTMQTMLKDLVRITSGAAPQGDTAKTRSTAATDSLRNYWANQEQYEAAVQRAQRYINEQYANDPEVLAVFNDWLSGSGINTWQLIGKALQENGVKFNEILMSSWQDKAQLLNKVTERILADTDLTQEESAKAAQYISDKFYDELAQRAEKKVAQLLKPTSHKQQKTMAQRVSEFINSGAFSDESIAELVKAKYGIPTLTSADVQKIYELNKLAQETDNDYQKRVYLNRAAKVISDKLPVTGKEKVLAVRRIAMLLNPKTLISRNAGGNVVFGLLEDIKDAPGTLVDLGVSAITGKRTTSYNPFATSKAEFLGMKKGLSEWGKDIKNKVDTSPTEHEMPRTPSFKGTVGRGFEEALNKLLQLGDRPFYEAAKEKRLDELKRLGLDHTSEDAIAEANVYALERVFQNNSTLAKKAVQLRDSLGVLGDIAIPFAQTPANIFDKLIDYSPYGFVRAIKKAGMVKDSAWSQKQFVDTLSRSLTGTGILAFAYFAAQAGLISGGEDREEDEGLSYQKKISGWQPYSIVVGDKTYTYDWATVVGALLSLGADIAQSENAGDTMLAILSAGAKAGINTMFNQSYLEGISELFGGEDIASGLESVLLGLPASFTPTAFQQIAKIIDPIARDTYDTDPFKRAWNKVKAKLPYASKTLPAKIGASGEELTNFQGSKATNIFESVLSPGYIGENQKTAIDTEAHRLYRATGDSGVLPKWSKYTSKGDMAITIDGEKLSMSTAEWGQYQKTRGKQTYKMLDELIKSPDYKSMTDAQKADAMQGIIGYASDIAKGEYAKTKGKVHESSTYAKVREVKAAGISPVKYFEYQNALKKERPEGGTPSQLQYSKAINTLNISNQQKGKLWDIQNGEHSDKNPFTGSLAQEGMPASESIQIMEAFKAIKSDMKSYEKADGGPGKSHVQAAYFRQWLYAAGYNAAQVSYIEEVFTTWQMIPIEKPSRKATAYVANNPLG